MLQPSGSYANVAITFDFRSILKEDVLDLNVAGIQSAYFARKNNVTLDDKRHQSFPLRLSPSLRQQAVEFAHSEGISLNHFIGIAVAEKVSRMESVLENNEAEKAQDKSLSLVPNPQNPE